MTDTFWAELKIPYQEEDSSFQFANTVVVAQHFLKSVGRAAQLGEQAEDLTRQIANVIIQRERKERQLKILRRQILAKHYAALAKSAAHEVREAFILAMAKEDDVLTELLAIESSINSFTILLEAMEPQVSQYRARLKMLETTVEWATQYINFEKFMMRAANSHG